MPLTAPAGRTFSFPIFLAGALLALALACGGGSNPTHGPATGVTLSTAGSITLPVPHDYGPSFYLPPYNGTLTVNVARGASVTGAVALAVTGLPANAKATFAQPSTTGTSDELTIQAGYPDNSDVTFTKQLYPATGTYTLTITATSTGVADASTTVTLNLVQESPDFSLAFVDPTGSFIDNPTDVSLANGVPVTLDLLAYYTTGMGWNTSSPVAMSIVGAPAGLTATFDGTTFSLEDQNPHTLTLTAQPSLAPGTYAFYLTATFNGKTRTLPVTVTVSPSPFYIRPLFNAAGPSVVQGGSIAFPLYLGHDDEYFGTVEPTDGTDPAYDGDTLITASGVPSGMTVSFGTAGAVKGLASVPMTIQATGGVPQGTYALILQATRTHTGGASVQAPPFTLPVTVTGNALGSVPAAWIQAVEWGQTVVRPGLTLVAGKPALLRVQVMGDRPGLTGAPTATLNGGAALALTGPATLPTSVAEGDLPVGGAASTSTWTAVIPPASVTAGLSVTVQSAALNLAPVTVTPQVLAVNPLPFVAVPIVYGGVQPALPADAAMARELTAFWPVPSVNVTHRAPYTTSTTIPTPNADPTLDHSSDGWGQLLSEVAMLRTVDNASGYYFGFFQLTFPLGFKGSSTVGISYQGEGVGIGLDVTSANGFSNPDSPQDAATMIMVHEEGHAFNLNHAPAGGAGFPQLNYPYAGADLGTWGYDATAGVAYDPATHYDVMSYADHAHWVSDWDYLAALGWLGGDQHHPGTLASRTGTVTSDQWVVSGWTDTAGTVHLAPLVRATCAPRPAVPGALHLALRTTGGDLDVPFSATRVPDLPAGQRHFLFTVPASGSILSAEILSGATRLARRTPRGPALRGQDLEAEAQAGTLVVHEEGGTLHLAWDAAQHPYVNVIHLGAQRTTLALHLTGGTADLPLEGLPPGGTFRVEYPDGLNAVARATARRTPVAPAID